MGGRGRHMTPDGGAQSCCDHFKQVGKYPRGGLSAQPAAQDKAGNII